MGGNIPYSFYVASPVLRIISTSYKKVIPGHTICGPQLHNKQHLFEFILKGDVFQHDNFLPFSTMHTSTIMILAGAELINEKEGGNKKYTLTTAKYNYILSSTAE